MIQMEKTFQLYMDRHLPLKEVVFRALREAILQGEFEAGDRLMEIHLADRLGVSRTPIREALHILEEEGLVEILPRRGAVVAGITEKQMQDVLEVRRALEELAAELCAGRITDEQLQELAKAAEVFQDSLESGDVNQIARADEKFHYIIPISTGNQQLIQLLTNFRERMYRYRVAYLHQEMIYPALVREHSEILASLKKHDPVGAVEAVRIHIDRQQQIMLEQVRSKNRNR